MKKFYAFVCAVVVALTASAGPIDFAPKAKKDITKLEIATKSAKTSLTNAKRVKHASRISVDDAGLEANKLYLEESYSFAANEEGKAAKGWQIDGPVKLLRAEDGTYIIEGFYGQDGINLTGGVYDAVENTLTFQPQIVASGLSQLGADFESVMVVTVDNEDTFLEDPIVFDVDIANRNLFYMCETDDEGNATTCLGLACLDTSNEPTGFMDWLAMIDMNQVNGMNIFGYHSSSTNKIERVQTYVYNEVVDGNLVTSGLFGEGFGYPVTFTLNKEASTAVADKQVVTKRRDGSGTYYDFMFYDVIFNEDSTDVAIGEPVVTFDIIPQEAEGATMTYIYKDYTFVGTPYNGEMAALVPGGIIYGFQILYVGDIFDPTGIHDVQLDKNTNAPVEYYNLQGIRVSEPTKGGIYIRRQGNVSTKIMR